jgi:hypothetical protein
MMKIGISKLVPDFFFYMGDHRLSREDVMGKILGLTGAVITVGHLRTGVLAPNGPRLRMSSSSKSGLLLVSIVSFGASAAGPGVRERRSCNSCECKQ